MTEVVYTSNPLTRRPIAQMYLADDPRVLLRASAAAERPISWHSPAPSAPQLPKEGCDESMESPTKQADMVDAVAHFSS